MIEVKQSFTFIPISNSYEKKIPSKYLVNLVAVGLSRY